MLITLLILILISNAVTINQEKSILYSRIVIQGLIFVAFIGYNNLYIKPLEKGIGLYGGLFNVTTFTQSFNIFIILLGSIIAILTAFYPRKLYNLGIESTGIEKLLLNKKSGQFVIIEYGLIMVFVLCGAVFLMSTGDLISMFLSIELQSYGLYILSTLYRDSESATGSGLTYFLLGGLSSCFILLGSALLYVNSGTTNLDNIYIITSINELSNKAIYWYQPYYLHFSLIILTVGFLFKISAAPFHFWSPDVYDGIPTIVTTFVAIIAKISIFVILLELVLYTEYNYSNTYFTLGHTSSFSQVLGVEEHNSLIPYNELEEKKEFRWKNILIFSSLISLIIGSVLGLTQYRIKRLFAYSTISHVGFILLALCINKIESVQGYIFYILQYSLSNLNAFIILVTIGFTLYFYVYSPNKENEEQYNKLIDVKNSPIQFINQLKGYFYINSFMSISLAITLFSFVGVPPLIGFFAKQMVLSAALEEGFVFMTLVGIITSVIGAVYYLNVVKLIFFYKSNYHLVTLKGRINEQKEEMLKLNNLSTYSSTLEKQVNSGLSTTISILTMLITLFIYIPGEWFNIISILSLTLFKI